MPQDRPNVLCIVVDAARRDRLGCYGYGRGTTPAIDDLATQSLLFERMITPAPWTIPSHASLLTGLYPREHGAHYPTPILRPDVTTLAGHLTAHGYATCCISNNGLLGRSSNVTQGFGRVLRRREYDFRSRRLRKTRDVLALPDSGGRAANRRIRRLLGELPRPFLLFVNFMECHWPYTPPRHPERRFARAGQGWLRSARRRLGMLRLSSWEAMARADRAERDLLADLYDAELACADARCGDLLDLLASAGLDRETIVLLTSDHGEHLGEHGLADHQGSLSQILVHVPFLARIPGARPRRVGGLVEFTDLFPSLCRLLHVPPPAVLQRRWDGVDAFALDGVGRPFAFSEWHHWGESRQAALRRAAPTFDFGRTPGAMEAVQDDRFKLVVGAGGRWMRLYDLAADPGEGRDLSTEHPTEVARLRAALERWRTECGAADPVYSREEEEAVERRLRELGYV